MEMVYCISRDRNRAALESSSLQEELPAMTDSTDPMEVCPKCGARQRDPDARFCQFCGEIMPAAAATRRRIILGSAGLVLTLLVVVVVIRLIGKGGLVPQMLHKPRRLAERVRSRFPSSRKGTCPLRRRRFPSLRRHLQSALRLAQRQSQQLSRRSCPRPPQNPPRRPRLHPLFG